MRKSNKIWIVIPIILLSYELSHADSLSIEEAKPIDSVTLDVPLVDTPFNFVGHGVAVPSMRQSLLVSTDFYETLHRAIGGPSGSAKWRRWPLIGADVLTQWLPLGNGWMHEEWHRAVMSRRRISSYNDINDIPIGRPLIAVSHVTDADLVALKREHPEEQVRLSAAGMESQTEQNLLFERHHFFDDSKTFDRMIMTINALQNTFYLSTCASREADRDTQTQNDADGADVAKRDFTGLDCTAWAYDLFRPNEPYTARGTHPSGVGLNRYITYSDLNDNERSFLRKQMMLSLVNLVDPFLLGFDHFQGHWGEREFQWNARLSHYLTSFGYTVDANLFLKWNEKKFLVQLHNGFNATRYFPGLTLEWYDQPIPWSPLSLSQKLTVWNQPNGQNVQTQRSDTMVAVSERLSYQLGCYAPYVGLEGKTPGWLAGDVYLDRNLTVWAGLQVRAF